MLLGGEYSGVRNLSGPYIPLRLKDSRQRHGSNPIQLEGSDARIVGLSCSTIKSGNSDSSEDDGSVRAR
jgi:hypothetical protein